MSRQSGRAGGGSSPSRRASRTTRRWRRPRSSPSGRSRRSACPQGLKLELFAAEPLLANPVAFGFDENGRFYVAETFRLHDGRHRYPQHMNWLDDDLACRTVADRVAMYRKYLGKEFAELRRSSTTASGSSRTRDGDGKADQADRLRRRLQRRSTDGIGAGVLARRGDVWLHLHPRPLAAPRHRRRRQGRRPQVAASRLRRPRRLPRPRPARPPLRARRQALLQHRRPRPERDDDRRPHARLPRHRRGAALRPRRHRAWRSSPPACATRRSWPSTSTATCSPCDNNSDGGDKARLGPRRRGRRQRLADRLPVPRRPRDRRGPWNAEKLWHPQCDGQAARTSCRRSPTSPTAPRA